MRCCVKSEPEMQAWDAQRSVYIFTMGGKLSTRELCIEKKNGILSFYVMTLDLLKANLESWGRLS